MRCDWSKAMGFPSGSMTVAIQPTVGISCFGVTIFPPSFLTFSMDLSMDSTEM